eukprot:8183-Heterococcus_DN1.PRE.1
MPIYAAVEGGGTTWRVALAEGHPSNIIESEVYETIDDAVEQLRIIREWLDKRKFDALGIATFGPIDPRPGSSTYGYITTTPKPGWANVDVVGALSNGKVPVQFDTDVNAPALAEYMCASMLAIAGAYNCLYAARPHQNLAWHLWKSTGGETSCAYITVGTGIGVGLVINGAPVHGLLHPERMVGDTFPGTDELFGASVEGLAATPALAARKGCDRSELAKLDDNDPIWEPVAHALAGLCATLVLVASPERIVLSGGVMNRSILYPMVRQKTQELLHGYINHSKITTKAIEDYIAPSQFGQRAGLIGALTLAHVALERSGAVHAPGSSSAKCEAVVAAAYSERE